MISVQRRLPKWASASGNMIMTLLPMIFSVHKSHSRHAFRNKNLIIPFSKILFVTDSRMRLVPELLV